ncbi:S53 family peptidase [Marinomonas mediterranea]|uniref:S53 family peptidase n=1 Tax=Marinomonas mediterranea TaxID=119864 RepID=UPI00234AE614|nr:S53 family peptidase [Marinomonas mediterranea]WCN09535.1 S8 family serine peptidase [Marinomonas mediterranea]
MEQFKPNTSVNTPFSGSENPFLSSVSQRLKQALSHYHTPKAVADFYQFPENLGEGQTIGVMTLGGAFNPEELDAYCRHLNITTPEVSIVGTEPVLPEENKKLADLEINMDIQLIVGLTPKAKIVLYYGKDFCNAFQAIIDDKENTPTVINICWAIGEKYLTRKEKETLLSQANQLCERGVTLLAASGDEGIFQSGTTAKRRVPGINLPAGFPNVIACGGTALTPDGIETVWNEAPFSSGGGFSLMTPAPEFQTEALSHYNHCYPEIDTHNIATPDLSANASIEYPSAVMRDGKLAKAWGTSASAPILSALIARIKTELKTPFGDINALLYQHIGSDVFNNDIQGENGYPATHKWNPCTGLGSPNGIKLMHAIKENIDVKTST